MAEHVETVIIGGGQAGLAASYHLAQRGREHLILDQAAAPANAWRNDRWDSFTLVTPNWTFRLPGSEYDGSEPDGFMPRAEIVRRFEDHVVNCRPPVRWGVRALAVEQADSGYRVDTVYGPVRAANVIIATGLFQKRKIPAFASQISPDILQLPAGHYRNPGALPEGAVLVVGSGQSGAQIAEELYQSGRKVYLCVGSAGRVPRRYRGKDTFAWLELAGFVDRPPSVLPSPRARFAGNPHLSGKAGGHSINLHQFARDGVTLLGKLEGVQDGRVRVAPDLKLNLAKVDAVEVEVLRLIDDYIARVGLDAPEEVLPVLRDGFDAVELSELDLRANRIGTIIWALGYSFDYSMVRLPVLDEYGFPVTDACATRFPGLFFLGMPWLVNQNSGLLGGVGRDAAHVAELIAAHGGAR